MLSVVIPVYNEPDWIARTVGDLRTALGRSPWADDHEIVIVDDGSSQPTQDALAALDGVRVIRQENQGRFGARVTGIRAAQGEDVLLLDSRISLHPDALAWVAPRLGEGRRVWNGHCLIDTEGNPFATFWDVLTRAAFAEYFADPRETSYGLEEYDRFPKGTTHFLAPRRYLLDALESFESRYEDLRNANDDTLLLRHIAGRERFNIAPQFSSLYRSRTSLKPFLRHAHHRGVVFFDGFARPGTRFFPVVVASFPGSLLGLLVAARRPRLAVAGGAAVAVAGAGLAARKGAGPREAAIVGALMPPFAAAYQAGIWRGALLALKAKRSR